MIEVDNNFLDKLFQLSEIKGFVKMKVDKKENFNEIMEEFIKTYPNIVKKYKMKTLTEGERKLFIILLYHNIFNLKLLGVKEFVQLLKRDIHYIKYLEKDSHLLSNGIIILSKGKKESHYSINQEIINRIVGTDIIKPVERHGIFSMFKSNQNFQIIERVNSNISFDDIILSTEIKNKILEALTIYTNFERVKNTLGNSDEIKELKRVVLLFYGPPGTGKTMTAKAISNYLKMPLYMVNIANTQSKWVGDNEKFIKKIFEEFSHKRKGILFFDEADSLFSTRLKGIGSPVGAMHNRVLNILLQEIEKVKKPVILTTNFEVNFDKAFERRITYKLKFDIPNQELRKLLWQLKMPKSIKFKKGIDFNYLSEFELTGAEIELICKNLLRTLAFKIANNKDDTLDYEDILYQIDNLKNNTQSKKLGFEL